MLTTSFDMIDETHREAGEKLVDWIVKNHKPGQPLQVTVVCTGNSRRSILGATMGNIAAAYYGMPEIRFHSGGTAPTAFNARTVVALKQIGVEIEPTGQEAPRGEPKTANPTYVVRWGTGMEATEFAKTYFDASNPQQGFAALMVCGEADAACPLVKGAAARISMPYLDPKIYDDSTYEALKYAERRDDIGQAHAQRDDAGAEPSRSGPTGPLNEQENDDVRTNHPGREIKIWLRGHKRALEQPRRREGRRRGVWIHAGGACLDPRRGEHGALLRQPDRFRQPAQG